MAQYQVRTGPVVNDPAPFSPEMVQGNLPQRSRQTKPIQIGQPIFQTAVVLPFFFEATNGYQDTRPRLQRGTQTRLDFVAAVTNIVNTDPPFGLQPQRGVDPNRRRSMRSCFMVIASPIPDFVDNTLPQTNRAFLGPRIGLPLTDLTIPPPFPNEAVRGYQPASPKLMLGPRIGLPISQTTHVQAPTNSADMWSGWKPVSPRLPFNRRINTVIVDPTTIIPPPPPSYIGDGILNAGGIDDGISVISTFMIGEF